MSICILRHQRVIWFGFVLHLHLTWCVPMNYFDANVILSPYTLMDFMTTVKNSCVAEEEDSEFIRKENK